MRQSQKNTQIPSTVTLRKAGKKIVLATGVFDILHQEHIVFLQKAKKEGDYLIVGLESDVRVRKIKGHDRPINPQSNRIKNIIKLNLVDRAFLLPEKFDTPKDHENLIKKIKPDVLAVSSHTKYIDKKSKIVEKYGGQVKIVHQHNPLFSTTLSIRKQK